MSHERRKHVRAPLTVTAELTLFAELGGTSKCLGTFPVLNVSAGGALVAGVAPTGLPRKLTAIIELAGGRPLRTEATLVRPSAVGTDPSFALHFTRLSASAEDALQAAVLATLEEARAASVLIVAPPTGAERCLARDLKRLGRTSFHVGATDAAMRFFELDPAVNLAFLDQRCAELGELLRYLGEAHPEVMRVVFAPSEPAVAEATRLTGVEHVVHTPASAQELRRLLQMRPHRRADAAPEARPL